ncbi:IS4-like element ISLpn1 family transposase, partial [Legionella pneumophila]
MHKKIFCQNLLDSALKNSIHAKRKQCLVRFLSDLMDYDTTLSVTEIGKKLTSKTTVKSKIYAAQTFVNNFKLERDIVCIYKSLAHFFWSHAKEIVVLIDWTGGCSEGYHVLEASIAAHGRSIPIYHEVHSESEQENAEIHRQFLLRLKEVIPSSLSVTIITDAGFHREWFQQVLELGWDVIGRIYSLYCYQIEGETNWHKVKDILFEGIGKASALGKVKLGKTKKAVEGYLYTYKEKLSGKVRKKKNKYPSHDKAHSNYYKNGWVLFSSLNKHARFLVSYYKKRMQIEQNFKDIKNEQLGMGLRRNQSSGKTRVNMLFFLAVLLIMIAWWFGLMIESLNKHRSYQANTIK